METKQVTINLSLDEFEGTLTEFKDLIADAVVTLTEYSKDMNEDDYSTINSPLYIIYKSIKEQERGTK